MNRAEANAIFPMGTTFKVENMGELTTDKPYGLLEAIGAIYHEATGNQVFGEEFMNRIAIIEIDRIRRIVKTRIRGH